MKTIRHSSLLLVAFAMLASACSNMNKTQKGAVIGAAGGAVAGGVIGRATGNTAAGVIIGAAVGGTVGSVIGRKMDKQAEEMKEVLGDAEVKRVGEGIVVEFKEKVLFGYDRSDLNTQSQAGLTKLHNVLQKYPDTNIEIIGHTDDKGSDQYNQGLSERRANSVASYLRSQGINGTRIKTRGMGESDPKVSNDNDTARAENRRVEFVITANEKMIDDAKKESGQR
ncbi:MAG TPA: OmpA family protein [Chitinophagaceae bacterium]|nr:OmpA family protein [Chitinophagaceae bacterium]